MAPKLLVRMRSLPGLDEAPMDRAARARGGRGSRAPASRRSRGPRANRLVPIAPSASSTALRRQQLVQRIGHGAAIRHGQPALVRRAPPPSRPAVGGAGPAGRTPSRAQLLDDLQPLGRGSRPARAAISSRVRMQPRHSPVVGSSRQMPTQGEGMSSTRDPSGQASRGGVETAQIEPRAPLSKRREVEAKRRRPRSAQCLRRASAWRSTARLCSTSPRPSGSSAAARQAASSRCRLPRDRLALRPGRA